MLSKIAIIIEKSSISLIRVNATRTGGSKVCCYRQCMDLRKDVLTFNHKPVRISIFLDFGNSDTTVSVFS